MKLTDKRFGKFEALMLLCGLLFFCTLTVDNLCNGAAAFASTNDIFLALIFNPLFSIFFALCGLPAWLLYDGGSWRSLAGCLYLVSSFMLILLFLSVAIYDFIIQYEAMGPSVNDAPLTLLFVFLTLLILLLPPILITSWLAKRWLFKTPKQP